MQLRLVRRVRTVILILAAVMFFCGTSLHPFYVSVTEMNHNASDKTFEISCKMFAEDIEQSIEKLSQKDLSITNEKDHAVFDKYLPEYFARHFSVMVDGKAVHGSYLGYEVEKESAYCYFQVDDIAGAKSITINNSILYDFNDTEINIMHVTVGGRRISQKVNYPESQATFSF